MQLQRFDSSIDHQAYDDARTREYLARGSDRERRRTIAEFILSTARIADDLKRFCDMADHADLLDQDASQLEAAMEQAETMIRDHFRRKFGREMV